MDRIKIQFSSNVSETLLIPLYIRAIESQRKNPILKDPMAEKLVNEIDYDFHRLDEHLDTGRCCIIRAKYYDVNIAKSAARQKSDTVVVNIGCGLDTRRLRLSGSNITFYELDLPDVIALRRKLMPLESHDNQITKSMFDTSWLDELHLAHPDSHFIFVFEGVLMYFDNSQVKYILNNIADRYPESEIYFDMCNKATLRSNFELLKNFKSHFKTGIDNGHEVEFMVRKLRLKDQRQYLDSVSIGSQYMDDWSLMQFRVMP